MRCFEYGSDELFLTESYPLSRSKCRYSFSNQYWAITITQRNKRRKDITDGKADDDRVGDLC